MNVDMRDESDCWYFIPVESLVTTVVEMIANILFQLWLYWWEWLEIILHFSKIRCIGKCRNECPCYFITAIWLVTALIDMIADNTSLDPNQWWLQWWFWLQITFSCSWNNGDDSGGKWYWIFLFQSNQSWLQRWKQLNLNKWWQWKW